MLVPLEALVWGDLKKHVRASMHQKRIMLVGKFALYQNWVLEHRSKIICHFSIAKFLREALFTSVRTVKTGMLVRSSGK